MCHESLDVRMCFSCFPSTKPSTCIVRPRTRILVRYGAVDRVLHGSTANTPYKLHKYTVGKADPNTCYSIAPNITGMKHLTFYTGNQLKQDLVHS